MPESVIYNDNFHSPTNTVDLTFSIDKLLVRTIDPQLETERKSLLKSIYASHDQYTDYLKRSTVSQLDRLIEEREELVKQCKAAKQTLDKLQSKNGTYGSTTNRLQEEYDVAQLNLNAERGRTLPAAYTTAEEYAAHDALIASLRDKCIDAGNQFNSHMQLTNAFEASLADAIEAHNSLVLKHSDTCNQIAKLQGKSVKHFDKTTGLETT